MIILVIVKIWPIGVVLILKIQDVRLLSITVMPIRLALDAIGWHLPMRMSRIV